jgi:hypothetical protein
MSSGRPGVGPDGLWALVAGVLVVGYSGRPELVLGGAGLGPVQCRCGKRGSGGASLTAACFPRGVVARGHVASAEN